MYVEEDKEGWEGDYTERIKDSGVLQHPGHSSLKNVK